MSPNLYGTNNQLRAAAVDKWVGVKGAPDSGGRGGAKTLFVYLILLSYLILKVKIKNKIAARNSGGGGEPPFVFLPPAGILGEPFYKIFQNVGPCGHIKGTLLQNIPKCWPLRAY